MAIQLRRTLAPEWWTPESQANEESPSRFLIKPLTSPEFERLAANNAGGFSSADHDDLIKYGLAGWENVNDDQTGEAIPYSHEAAGMLPLRLRGEIVNEIFRSLDMGEEETKN